jgi:hypothetical protein
VAVEATTFAVAAEEFDKILVDSSIGENKDFTAAVLKPDEVDVEVEDDAPELLL